MKEVGSYEAKTHLAKLLDEVTRGERICITRKGKPVAMLVPVQAGKRDPRAVVREIRKRRQGVRLGKLSIRSLIEEGRRF